LILFARTIPLCQCLRIVEFEQRGSDRAEYGAGLLQRLSEHLGTLGVRGTSISGLRSYRQFYSTYPQLGETVAAEIRAISGRQIHQAAPVELGSDGFSLLLRWPLRIQQEPPAEFQVVENQRVSSLSPSPQKLLRHFSFTHFVELMRSEDPLKRAFYEIEGIKGNWSVPQLKRQIETLLYERTGMSKDKHGLVDAVHAQKRVTTIDEVIRDPYILEFSGFPEDYRFSEHDLETRLLDHIQSFLLELGNGFCFEARQKRITLDNEHDRIDLVFYHRILRCHVLIDLKARKFQHGGCGTDLSRAESRDELLLELLSREHDG
jgi:predicted nuclease of restriction endonuclease-like (RecB) superfamily